MGRVTIFRLEITDQANEVSLFSAFSGQRGQRSGSGSDGTVAVVTASDAARRLELLDDFEQAGIGWIWATDAEGRLIYMSENAATRLGQPVDILLGQSLSDLFEVDPENPTAKSDRPLKFQLAAHKKIADLVVRFINGKTRSAPDQTWWLISGHPKLDADGQFLGFRGSAKDVTVEYERQLADSLLAEYDSLTGMANRHRMTRRLDTTLAAFKEAKRSCALVMLDLDRFKQVNDTMGHPAGDTLLKMVGERLASIVGKRGEIGRLGGDEFQIILPDIEDRGALGELASKIVQFVSQPYPIDDKHAVIGTSIGVAIAPYDGLDREELVRNADLALYAAKNGGRGQFRFYSDDLKDEAADRQTLLDELRNALENEELALHYQPVVRVSDNVVVGCEALMRWDHPERGSIPPSTFIPLAEESNLINRLGEWALRYACIEAAHWPGAVRVAVNVSAVQFTDDQFVDIVADALSKSGLEPSRLELELTESIFLNDSETTDSVFSRLKQLGVSLALDDFGTGFSSLSYLRSAPFDKLKVDRSFVDSCTTKDHNSIKIIAAIIGLAEALGMDTTVEGVEAFDQLELVCSKGAKYVQGWLYAKAIPNSELVERMEAGEFCIVPNGPDRFRPERRTMFRRIGIIHDDHRYEAIIRDLSIVGARIEGLLGVTQGEQMVLDLGKGQLVVATVTRTTERDFGVEFETPLVNDGAGGLCTRHRVSPYALAAAGMPLAALGSSSIAIFPRSEAPKSPPKFVEVAVSAGARAA
ncbi:EAL domain-containing protein [Sphingomonas lacunae]|uniref:EAL domain-containing protein n=1 Tax=Sphingomonas lacunae TaxID=2698828 RepID=A0A6M4AWU1_9SPHN|nr:EAL domain-containing protein [Sphingomonas lacunae]